MNTNEHLIAYLTLITSSWKINGQTYIIILYLTVQRFILLMRYLLRLSIRNMLRTEEHVGSKCVVHRWHTLKQGEWYYSSRIPEEAAIAKLRNVCLCYQKSFQPAESTKLSVLSLAVIELTFPIAALIVLSFAFVARIMLVTHQCSDHW